MSPNTVTHLLRGGTEQNNDNWRSDRHSNCTSTIPIHNVNQARCVSSYKYDDVRVVAFRDNYSFLSSAKQFRTVRLINNDVLGKLAGSAFSILAYRLLQNVRTYRGCPRRNVPDFGRVFLMLKYTDITQNTYVQS